MAWAGPTQIGLCQRHRSYLKPVIGGKESEVGPGSEARSIKPIGNLPFTATEPANRPNPGSA